MQKQVILTVYSHWYDYLSGFIDETPEDHRESAGGIF